MTHVLSTFEVGKIMGSARSDVGECEGQGEGYVAMWLFAKSHKIWLFAKSHKIWLFAKSHKIWLFAKSHKIWLFAKSHILSIYS